MTIRTRLSALTVASMLALTGCGDLSSLDSSAEVDEVTITEGSDPAGKQDKKPKETTVKTAIPGDGTWVVPGDIKPGVYVAVDPGSCYWERLSGLGGEFSDMIANDNVKGQAVVEVRKGDKALATNRCGGWVKIGQIPRDPQKSIPGDGTWIVGKQIAPGTYRATGASNCYWERVSAFTGEFGDMIANDNANGQAVVQIKPSDAGFTSNRCGKWQKVG